MQENIDKRFQQNIAQNKITDKKSEQCHKCPATSIFLLNDIPFLLNHILCSKLSPLPSHNSSRSNYSDHSHSMPLSLLLLHSLNTLALSCSCSSFPVPYYTLFPPSFPPHPTPSRPGPIFLINPNKKILLYRQISRAHHT